MKRPLTAAVIVLSLVAVEAADWPQFQGPDRTRISKETGLLKEWPATGPRVIWTANNLGGGYGSIAVAADRVFLQGARGTDSVVIALNRTDGKEVWAKPPVDGPHVVVAPGGPGAGMVKLGKMTGKTVWTSKELGDTAAYSSITAADVQGIRTYITFTATAGVGVRASDGKLMFRYPKAVNNVANIATPIFFNNKVFFTSGYGAGGGLLDLTVKDGEVAAVEAYHTNDMRNHHGGVVLVDGHLCGFSDLILTCLEFATGNVIWRDRSVGKGSVTYAVGHLYIQSENNMVALAEATPSGYREKGRFAIPEKGQMSWAHPAISDGRLYVRNQDTLLVYDIKRRRPSAV